MTAPNMTRPAAPRPNLPKGLKWSSVWKVDGQFVEAEQPADGNPRVELPVNDAWQICGQLWVCPAPGCEHTAWTFEQANVDDPPCCPRHPSRLVHSRLDAAEADPVGGARARVAAHVRGIYDRRKKAALEATQRRADLARKAVEDATRRTAADMRGHLPSIAASGLTIAAGAPLVLTDAPLAAAVGAGTCLFGAVAAYLVAYWVRRMRKVAQRDAKQARKDRQVARHVASGVLATGVWLLLSSAVSVLPTPAHVIFTVLLGFLLSFAVNNAHWTELWATRHRLKEMARLRAEAEARRAAEEAARVQSPAPAQPEVEPDGDDPDVVGARMAAEWMRVSHTPAAGNAFPQMARTWISPDAAKPVNAPIDGKIVRIGWEFAGHSEPGALVAGRGAMTPPVVAARDWLAAVLFDGRHNPSAISILDRPGGAANRFTLMITDSAPLGEPVRWQGKAGVKRLPNGTVLVHRGRSIDGNDMHHPLYIPGQAFGGLVVGTRGGGKTAGTILYLLNCLAAGVFPTLFDPKQLVDYADFIGVFPIGVTLTHRDIFTDWLVAERKRRERLMARRPVLDEFGRQVHGESMWDLRDGPAISHNWEEFHDLAQDEQWVNGRMTNHIRFERAVWMGGRFVTQGGGLADLSNSVLRGLLNQTELTTYRMDDHQARLAGRKDGGYTASDLPPLPGMCLVTAPEAAPMPMRDAYVPRTVNHPESVFNVLYGRSAAKVLQLPTPKLPEEMLAVMRRTGMLELWTRAQGDGGLDRLLADAEDEEYGGPSPVPNAAGTATAGSIIAADVLLAIAYRCPGMGPTAISQDNTWLLPKAGGRPPVLSTITRPAAKLEKDGLLTRDGGYRVTDKGTKRAAEVAAVLYPPTAAVAEQVSERAAETEVPV
jgi:hypothetical protein